METMIITLVTIILVCFSFLFIAIQTNNILEEEERKQEEYEKENYFSNTTDIDSDFWNE